MSGIEKFIRKVCVQTAVYWEFDVADGFGGNTFKDPVEVSVRWEDKVELLRDETGKEIVSRATILTPIDLKVQSILWLGTLEDLTESQKEDPLSVQGAGPILKFDRVPMIFSTTVFVKTAYL